MSFPATVNQMDYIDWLIHEIDKYYITINKALNIETSNDLTFKEALEDIDYLIKVLKG